MREVLLSLERSSEAGFTPAQQSYEVSLFDRYGNFKALYQTQSPSIMLPFTHSGQFYKFSDTRFYVCEGVGALFYKDYTKELDLELLDLNELDYYLCNGCIRSADFRQIALIELFLKIADINIAKQCSYLVPKGYLYAQNKLLS